MNIKNAVDKAYESKSLKELVDAPVDALQGISAADGQKLIECLGVKTIGDLAKNKYVKWAQGIVALAETEA